ncbi:hypothetical protein D3C72_956850 [compost metagenome]
MDLAAGLWQLELDRVGEQGGRDHEDDEQHQHDIYHGDHVDLGQRLIVRVTWEFAEGHYICPCLALSTAASGVTLALVCSTPVTSKAKRS